MKTQIKSYLTYIKAIGLRNELPINSSMFELMKYSRRERSLTLVFSSGRVYRYGSIEPDLCRKFIHADSKGKFFNQYIRDVYPFIEDTLI